MRKVLRGSREWCTAIVAGGLGTLLGSCEQKLGVKLYSREGSIEVASLAELDEAVLVVSQAVNAPVRDRKRDMDGYPMFVLSNRDVTVFVRKRFGEPCELAQGCRWNYSVSATDTALDQRRQKQAVDSAFKAITGSRV